MKVATDAAAHVRSRRLELFAATGTAALDDEPDTVQTKSNPTDPVTIVDTETEALVRRQLADLRPHDRILGEEEGGAATDLAGVRWVVDPIDGTVNFVYGIPAYAVSVAAQIDGHSVAAAVVDVPNAVTYSAAAGHGATRTDANGVVTDLRCNSVASVSLALVATGFGYGASRRERQGELIAQLLPRVRDIRRVGSAALDLCMVASGLVDAHFEHGLGPWDWAGGALVAAEAGAVVRVPSAATSSDAGEVVVACAPGIADELDVVFGELGVYASIPDR